MSESKSESLYVCKCGKEFTNRNQFNGHKAQCKEYLISIGKYERRQEIQQKFTTIGAIKGAQARSYQLEQHRKTELENWISEQHICEKCGKIMTEKYGSGRFCSRACANSRNHSDESKEKTSQSLIKRYGKSPLKREFSKTCPHCNFNISYEQRNRKTCPSCQNYLDGRVRPEPKLKKNQTKTYHKSKKSNTKYQYVGPELPSIEYEKRKPGFPSRRKLSYAEQFWKRVLDNNHVNYEHDYKILNRAGTAVYRLDFLIDGKIDLEIDGSQHEDMIYSDVIRYIYLEELGYKQFRIKWVNPNTELNKMIVNCQIEQMLEFIGYARIC